MKGIDEQKITYNGCEITEKNPIKKLIKRLGRKLSFWYIHPFGEKQNQFNDSVSNALDELYQAQLKVEDYYKKIENLVMEVATVQASYKALLNEFNAVKLRSTLNSNNIQRIQNAINEGNKGIEDYLIDVKPEIRKGVNKTEIKELTSYGYSGLGEKIASLKRAGQDSPATARLLLEIEQCYLKGAKNELDLIKYRHQRSTIAVICIGLYGSLGMEAIRNEAFGLYTMLKNKSIYNARMISIEPDFTDIVEKDGVTYLPMFDSAKVRSYMDEVNPQLCIFCESTANILLIDNGSFLMFRSLVKLSGQNPLQGINGNLIEELTHLNDFGIHKYCVQSKTAYDIMVKAGFKEPVILYPFMDYNSEKFNVKRKAFDSSRLVVGFASSPMGEEQMENRGMTLLGELIKLMPEVTFKILWRNEALAVPEDIKDATNAVVEYGVYDMNRFYSEIDILLIPYKDIDYNHACSLSGLEAMHNGIPVVATRVSGVSEVVEYCGIGEVADNNAESLAEAIRITAQNYEKYENEINKDKLVSYLDEVNALKLIENEMLVEIPSGVVTLHEWDRQLRQNDKYLVKGQKAMREYYSNNEVAVTYNANRFETFPENCFDLLERKSINIIIEDYFNKSDLKILDIACGDGRILQENLRYGNCTAVDSSEAMLSIVRKRFEDKLDRLETVNADFFDDNVDGKFDVITTFRYIRHFEYAKRKELYEKLKQNLKQNGLLIFDVPNINFEIKQKLEHGWGSYNIYDVFWQKDGFIDEMEKNGFIVKYIIPVGQGLASQTMSDYKLEPMTWTVAVSKQ